MRPITLLLVTSLGCTAAAPSPAPATTIAEAPLPTPLPAGRWVAESVERTTCIDCPTARFAVVLATGTLEGLSERDWPELAPGYPLFLAEGELGLPFDGPVAVVGGLYAAREDAEAVATRLGARALPLPERPSLGATTIVTITDTTKAMNEPRGDVARCTPSLGERFEVERDQLDRMADATWWLPVSCGDDRAFVPVTATDFDRTTSVVAGRVRTVQPVSGVCGIRYYRERTEGADGRWHERELSSDPSCVAELDPSDSWSACPERTLASCVDRASSLDGDARHAERLMSYACRFGHLEGCSRLVSMNVDRGLGLLWGWCHGEREDSCERLDAALRATDPSTLEGNAGGLELYACERGLEPWCQRLDASPVCDRQGCG